MPVTHTKDAHYWTQLRSALTGGQWAASFPAKTPNGVVLSWSELLRKFKKHCKGFADVAEIASQTQALALLLGANSNDEDQDGVEDTPYGSLYLGNECVLPEERMEEAAVGYEELRKLSCSNFDTLNFALAYYAYALGRPSECLLHISKIPDLPDIQSHIPTPASIRSNLSVLVPGGSTDSSLSWAGSFASDTSTSIAEIRDGRAWAMTETIRSLCLQGMAHEILAPSEPKKALKSYRTALPLLSIAESEISAVLPSTIPPISSSSGVGKIDFPSFTRFRELWRWIERLIWRAVVLTARTCNINEEGQEDSVWTWLSHYMACSSHWPATFRTRHRSVISVLHLHALILRAKSPLQPAISPTATLLSPPPPPPPPPLPLQESRRPPAWVHTARSVVQEYRAILTVSTYFPRAGERNVKVENFVDLCVAVWEASGEIGDFVGWVIDILWWATRLTFNSHRILRHMTRLLYISGDTELAKRTLRLYVQVVSKAHLAGGGDADADSDRCWVETLVQGARMLCRFAMSATGLEGIKDGWEAGELIKKARTRLVPDDKALVASLDLAEGIWSMVMALKEQEPRTRPERLSHSHALFLRSVETLPTPSGHYHLALSFARPGPKQDFDQAISNLQSALVAEPGEIRFWHALGLVLAATEQWAAAKGALEQGAEIGEQELGCGDFAESLPSPVLAAAAVVEFDGVRTKDFGVDDVAGTNGDVGGFQIHDTSHEHEHEHRHRHRHRRGHEHGHGHELNGDRVDDRDRDDNSDPSHLIPVIYLVNDAAKTISPAECLLRPLLDHPPSSRREVLEHALQLRMTQVAVAEYVEGPEAAGAKWLEVFTWIADKRDRIAMSGPGLAEDVKAPLDVVVVPLPEDATHVHVHAHVHAHASVVHASMVELPPHGDATPPIHITPASHPNSPRGSSFERLSPIKERGSGNLNFGTGSTGGGGGTGTSPGGDTSKGKKVQQILKHHVHQGQARISTISRKIGHGVVRTGNLRRSNSAPDFHSALRATHYQASSIHSRRRLSSLMYSNDNRTPTESPPPPPPPPSPPPVPVPASAQRMTKGNSRVWRENRLFSDLWLMSAATLRRSGKIEQAKGAIQEAEVRDEENPAVWVQLGLYYVALGREREAVDAFHKALFIAPDDISATVHLCRLYLLSTTLTQSRGNTIITSASASTASTGTSSTRNANGSNGNGNGNGNGNANGGSVFRNTDADNVDLAAGLLEPLARGAGWDVPEVWYFLAKACGMQGRSERARECLGFALGLSEGRGVREIGVAVGWCL